MDQDEALRQLREAKEKSKVKFLYATTTEAVSMRVWNGKKPIEKNVEVKVIPAGTRVLVNTISKHGTVGIRDEDLSPPTIGYYARIVPDHLTDWSESV